MRDICGLKTGFRMVSRDNGVVLSLSFSRTLLALQKNSNFCHLILAIECQVKINCERKTIAVFFFHSQHVLILEFIFFYHNYLGHFDTHFQRRFTSPNFFSC